MWTAVLVLLIVQGAFIVRHETLLSQGGPAGPPQAEGDSEVSGPQALKFGVGKAMFSERQMQLVHEGQDYWLEAFIEKHEIQPDDATTLRWQLVEHMRRLNEIKMMEYRGAHDETQSDTLMQRDRQRIRAEVRHLLGDDIGEAMHRELRTDWEPDEAPPADGP
jgi:hypothetical protein